jgi:hypothetical protein
MAWIKAGSTTLGSANSDIDVTSISNNIFNTVITHTVGSSGNDNLHLKLGNGSIDTGYNFASRASEDGATDGTSASANHIQFGGGSNVYPNFSIGYFVNISSEEKLMINHNMNQMNLGSGTAPKRREQVGKWSNTNNVFDIMRATTTVSSTWNTDSNITVIGSDGTESMRIQDGAIFYETDTNKEYLLSNNTWTEL